MKADYCNSTCEIMAACTRVAVMEMVELSNSARISKAEHKDLPIA